MHLNFDAHYEYALDRQHRLRAEAAAHRLTRSTPVTTRLARYLGLAKDCVDGAKGRVDGAMTPRRRPGDTAAEHI